MMADSGTGLFGILPEQMSAVRPTGAPRLRKAERRQVSLRPVSLEDLLPADHRARFVWAFAERLDLSALYGAIRAVEGRPGHPPADPRVLPALWLGVAVFAPVPKPRDPARDPHAPRDGDGPGVAARRRRMGSGAAKAVYKERAAT